MYMYDVVCLSVCLSHSQFQCVHFNSWDNNKDWSVTLPSKESIATIAMGDGWIAMATNKQLLRLFTVGGVQKEVISLPGPAVTLAGWGGRLAVVYHTGPGRYMWSSMYVLGKNT